ncbi:MAG: hypothetical protein ACLGI6_12150 [Gammaproteobacteria bacterium]
MVDETRDRAVNMDAKIKNDGIKRQPHERDESPDGQDQDNPRGVIKQAASDLERGLVDTDLHGMRGQEETIPDAPQDQQAKPLEDNNKGFRHADSVVKSRGGE